MEDNIIEEAFNNSYDLLMNKYEFEDLLADDMKQKKATALAHDPSNVEAQSYMDVIRFFTYTEEYEKCSELKKVMNKNYPETILPEE